MRETTILLKLHTFSLFFIHKVIYEAIIVILEAENVREFFEYPCEHVIYQIFYEKNYKRICLKN
jgi:hypothetical protein